MNSKIKNIFCPHWVELASSYCERSWAQTAEKLSLNPVYDEHAQFVIDSARDDLRRGCIVSELLTFLFAKVGLTVNEKDQILRNFLQKVDLKVCGGVWLKSTWFDKLRGYIQHAYNFVIANNYFVSGSKNASKSVF